MGRYSGKTCRLLSMLSMTASFFLVEIIVGYITNSIALVADSFHMLSDVVALIVGFASVRISKWRSQKNTFGWARAEVLGALVNAVFLLALCFSILVESLKRLVEVEKIEDPKLMLIVGALGLGINLVGLVLFGHHGHSHGGGGGHGHSHGGDKDSHGSSHGHSHGDHDKGSGHSHGNHTPDSDDHAEATALVEQRPSEESENGVIVVSDSAEACQDRESLRVEIDMAEVKVASSSQLNMRAVFLHVLGDALGSVIVIISALVIWFARGEWVFYVDPAMSILLVIIILGTTIPLLKESAMILLQTVPTHIQVHNIKEKLEKVDGVLAVHELHVWQLAGSRIIASAHIRCHNLKEYMSLATKIKDLFHNEGIHSTTIQPEFVDFHETSPDRDCVLECGPDMKCHPDTCCAERKNPRLGSQGTSPSQVRLRTAATASTSADGDSPKNEAKSVSCFKK